MTLNEAIEYLKQYNYPENDFFNPVIPYQDLDDYKEAVDTLMSQIEKINEPLSLKDLRNMDNETVDIEFFSEKAIGRVDLERNQIYALCGYDLRPIHLDLNDVGKSFYVYHRGKE